MYNPNQLYIDPILTGFSVGFQDQTLVGENIFPATRVMTKSGRYRVFDRSSWLIHDDRREPGTVANEVGGRKWSEDTFSVREHSLQSPVFDEERQELESQGGLADPVFGGALQINPERDAVEDITYSIMLGHEKKVADTVRDVSNYGTGHHAALSGSNRWDIWTKDTANIGDMPDSDPIKNIKTGMKAVYKDTHRNANTIVFSWDAWYSFYDHPRIVDRFKSFQLDLGSDFAAFKALTGFNGSIYIAESVVNTADNVDIDEDIVELWGTDVWIGIVDPVPGQRTKTFAKTFYFPYPDGSSRPVDRWREEARKADLFRVSYNYDTKIVSPEAGYLLQTVVG